MNNIGYLARFKCVDCGRMRAKRMYHGCGNDMNLFIFDFSQSYNITLHGRPHGYH